MLSGKSILRASEGTITAGQGFLVLFHPLTNFEKRVYSRNNLPKKRMEHM